MKLVVVSGGVYSGIGKGVVAASIAWLLQQQDREVVNVKWDGYHNHSAATLSPNEHGEVFVLSDGSEVDLDFGTYEAFRDSCSRGEESLTRGKLNALVAKNENGRTIEESDLCRWFADHIEKQKADVVVLELGGTVGDESLRLATQAVRKLARQHEVSFVHVAPLLFSVDSSEPKTRAVQHSILRHVKSLGPIDKLILRVPRGFTQLPEQQRAKILSCADIAEIVVLPSLTSVYEVPDFLSQKGVVGQAAFFAPLPPEAPKVRVALCGKYEVADAYKSVKEALFHAAHKLGFQLQLVSEIDPSVQAILVPGGYGSRGIERMMQAIEWARTRNVPFLGICYGMHLAVIEHCRNVCGWTGATSSEWEKRKNPETHVVHCLRPKPQLQFLGARDISLSQGSRAAQMYGGLTASERFRHRYGINVASLPAKFSLEFTGQTKEYPAVLEDPKHRFFVATQAHPEFTSTLRFPNPIFLGFIRAATE